MAGDYLTSGGIHFTGLGNGTDFDQIIQATLTAESFTLRRHEKTRTLYEKQVEDIQELNVKMLELQTHLATMDDPDEFLSKTATSTDDSIVTGTATSKARNGTYKVEVHQLAQAAVITSDTGYSDKTALVNDTGTAQSLFIRYAEESVVEVEVPDGTTLEELSAIINKHPGLRKQQEEDDTDDDSEGLVGTTLSSTPSVRSAVVSDGTDYFLQIRGMETGAEHTLEISSTFELSAGAVQTSAVDKFTYDAATDIINTSGAGQSISVVYDGGTPITIMLPDTTSLEDAADLINNDAANTGLFTASVASNEEGKYFLRVESNDPTKAVAVSSTIDQTIAVNSSTYSALTDNINTTGLLQTLDITYAGGTPVNIDVPPDTTLEGLVDLINADSNNPGVEASIGSNAGALFLQIESQDPLDPGNTVEIDSGLSDFATANWGYANDWETFSRLGTTTQSPQDAMIKVDDWPTGSYITSADNTITDVVEGITFTARNMGTEEVTVNIDEDGVVENIKSFIEKLNAVYVHIKSLQKISGDATLSGNEEYDSETTTIEELKLRSNPLQSDHNLRAIKGMLQNILAQKAAGFDYDAHHYSALSQMGIGTDASSAEGIGLLALDESVFREELRNNPDELAALFTLNNTGDTSTTDFRFQTAVAGTTKGGIYDVSYDIIPDPDNPGEFIIDPDTAMMNGRKAIVTGREIVGQTKSTDERTHSEDTWDEAGLAVTVLNMAQGSYTGQVRVQQGKFVELGDAVDRIAYSEDETGGDRMLYSLYTRYMGEDGSVGDGSIMGTSKDGLLDNIDEKIRYEEKRLARLEYTLRTKYANLDVVLQRYSGIQNSLNNQNWG